MALQPSTFINRGLTTVPKVESISSSKPSPSLISTYLSVGVPAGKYMKRRKHLSAPYNSFSLSSFKLYSS
ncbi:hypothetical protein MTR_4g036065 [Medicago truncatula]|uniref:Uncharacterized protein n=1 Tax=Medicago truncatula TaxID=3880 RepID=A0A072UU56_MEDTR|nr:hypothetical protein MTR_4g036065 [Medicago truncatula]